MPVIHVVNASPRSALGTAAVSRPAISLDASFTAAARAAGIIGKNEMVDPYANELNFLFAAFIFEDVGVTAYKGAAPLISNKTYISVDMSVALGWGGEFRPAESAIIAGGNGGPERQPSGVGLPFGLPVAFGPLGPGGDVLYQQPGTPRPWQVPRRSPPKSKKKLAFSGDSWNLHTFKCGSAPVNLRAGTATHESI